MNLTYFKYTRRFDLEKEEYEEMSFTIAFDDNDTKEGSKTKIDRVIEATQNLAIKNSLKGKDPECHTEKKK